jgi:hypothetical protein
MRRGGNERQDAGGFPGRFVANSTNVYSGPSLVDTKVTGQGWEWVLVGKNGTGIGYVTVSMLSPTDKYVP